MEVVEGYKGPERRAHPRFHIIFPAFLRLSVIKACLPWPSAVFSIEI
jgi:hypothetical protein